MYIRFEHIWVRKSTESYLPNNKIYKLFPLLSLSLSGTLIPFGFRLERDPKNIIHHSCDVWYYPDQVLDFLLFDRHEFTNRNFQSAILVRIFSLPVHSTFHLFSRFDWQDQFIFLENFFLWNLMLSGFQHSL